MGMVDSRELAQQAGKDVEGANGRCGRHATGPSSAPLPATLPLRYQPAAFGWPPLSATSQKSALLISSPTVTEDTGGEAEEGGD